MPRTSGESESARKPRAPVQRARPWLTLVDSLVASLQHGRPLTFVVGAGASISSGAPSTAAVEKCWLTDHGSLFADRGSFHKGVADLNDDQKINPIRPLFEEVHPFIGYHCLAALGRERPVMVLNLNWDDALENACLALDVPHFILTVDSRKGSLIGERRTAALKGMKEGKPGVYCLHVHGRLNDPESGIRFGVYETLEFSQDVKELIEKFFFENATVVIGASLRGDYDVIDLLRTLSEGSPGFPRKLSPFYIFSRQGTPSGTPSDGLMQNVLFSRKSAPNFRGHPAVDFDRLLLDLSTRLRGEEFASSIDGRPTMIPKLEQFAIPSANVIGSQSDHAGQYAIVLEGDAKVGKTNAALLLGHLAQLCDELEPSSERHSGPKPCADALRAFLAAKRSETPNRVLILDDPFGKSDDFDPNEEFVTLFERYLRQRPKDFRRAAKTRVVITTRASNWRRATTGTDIASSTVVRSIAMSEWFGESELSAYTEAKTNSEALARRETHRRELATPVAIREALSNASGPREAMVEEKIAFLRALDEDTAWYVMLARLQELWPDGVADLPLHETVDGGEGAFAKANLMLRKETLDEGTDCQHTYVVPAHSTDREAIDRFFAERSDELSSRLEELERNRGRVGGACRLWNAVRDIREGSVEGLKDPGRAAATWARRRLVADRGVGLPSESTSDSSRWLDGAAARRWTVRERSTSTGPTVTSCSVSPSLTRRPICCSPILPRRARRGSPHARSSDSATSSRARS